MKTKKNRFFSTKSFLFYKIFLWVITGILFVNFSAFIPSGSSGIDKEIIVFLFLALVINTGIATLFSKISKKSKWNYILILTGLVLICTLFEMTLFYKEFSLMISSFTYNRTVYLVIFCYIFLRNLAIFVFFLWLESFNQLIIFYKQKELVYQEEIALLIEKQEFERKFSRQKLLPHYFFNILEHVYAHSLIHHSDSELLDKVKFILYYFLVDVDKETVELDKELEFYKYYIDLEKFRSNENISVHFNVIGKTENLTILPLLFEPLIGNAMKHTMHDGMGKVDITVDVTHWPVLNFYCKNNYCKRTSHIVSSENGLKILKQRLELCYKNKYELKIAQNDDFYEVLLSITMN